MTAVRTEREASPAVPFRLPILTFHHLAGSVPYYTAIDGDFFRTLIERLSACYRFVSLREALETMRHGKSPVGLLLLTFDDAYADNLDLLRWARENFDARGIIFAIADHIGKTNAWNVKAPYITRHLTFDELRSLIELGFEVGSHTRSHHNLMKFETADAIHSEIVESKEILQKALGIEITALSYPYGQSSPLARQVAQTTYRCAFATNGKSALRNWREDVYNVGRISVHKDASLESVEREIARFQQ
jgi:peptidoglycan/xylan/chitin deacetylase (PgdA/CDA1 family)